jgi:predicted dienelactone hydrolase
MKCDASRTFIIATLLILALPMGTVSIDAQNKKSESTDLYKSKPGKFETKIVDRISLQEKKREQPLQLRVTYPVTAADQKLPVIIFSHGAGGSRKNYQPLVKHWASHGYVCIQPTHGDSISMLPRGEWRKYRSVREYINSGVLGKHQLTRPDDIKLVLDQMSKIEDQIPALKGRLDSKRIGMGGHSFGAHTTQMIGGLSLSGLGKRRITADDTRPQALLMISPQGTGNQIDRESWENIDRPTMVVTGTNDHGRQGQSYKWRLQVYENVPAQQKYLTFVKDATHNFGGISGARYPGSGAKNDNHVSYVQSATIAFWDAHLKDDAQAKKYLQSKKMSTATKDRATISWPGKSSEAEKRESSR